MDSKPPTVMSKHMNKLIKDSVTFSRKGKYLMMEYIQSH